MTVPCTSIQSHVCTVEKYSRASMQSCKLKEGRTWQHITLQPLTCRVEMAKEASGAEQTRLVIEWHTQMRGDRQGQIIVLVRLQLLTIGIARVWRNTDVCPSYVLWDTDWFPIPFA